MESTKCYPGKLQRKRSNSGSLIKDMEGEGARLHDTVSSHSYE